MTKPKKPSAKEKWAAYRERLREDAVNKELMSTADTIITIHKDGTTTERPGPMSEDPPPPKVKVKAKVEPWYKRLRKRLT